MHLTNQYYPSTTCSIKKLGSLKHRPFSLNVIYDMIKQKNIKTRRHIYFGMCFLIRLLLQNRVGFTQASFHQLLISNKAFDAFSLSTYIKLIGLRTSNPLGTAGFF